MTLEQFKNKHKIKAKRISKLTDFQEDILQLHSENVSLKNIHLFLSENNCEISIPAIWKFIQKYLRNKEVCVSKPEDKKSSFSKIDEVPKAKNKQIAQAQKNGKKILMKKSDVQEFDYRFASPPKDLQ